MHKIQTKLIKVKLYYTLSSTIEVVSIDIQCI